MTTDRPTRVRMRDVAARAGVSSATVSFVMNDSPGSRIPAPTRDLVLRAARELGYRPNHTARSLRTRITRTVGLVSDRIVTDDYGGDLIRGSLMAALDREHLLLVVETQDDDVVEARVLEDLLSREVDGIVYATQSSEQVSLPALLHDQRVVLLNCTADRPVPTVVPDEHRGGRAAAQVLLEAGHRDGIHLVGETPDRLRPARERRAGVEEALREAGAGLAGVIDTVWWPEQAHGAVAAALASALAAGTLPRALVCLNDRIAFGAYQALGDLGLRVPDDVSIVSFDDSELARWLRPAVTSVAMPYYEMGRLAVDTLLQPGPPREQLVAMQVSRRSSVGPPRRGA